MIKAIIIWIAIMIYTSIALGTGIIAIKRGFSAKNESDEIIFCVAGSLAILSGIAVFLTALNSLI